jgi:hypothetical protein
VPAPPAWFGQRLRDSVISLIDRHELGRRASSGRLMAETFSAKSSSSN